MAKYKVYYEGSELFIQAERVEIGPTGEMCLQDGKYSNVAVFPSGTVVINVDAIKDE